MVLRQDFFGKCFHFVQIYLRVFKPAFGIGTLLAGLVPMLWAAGTGSEIMRPMAAPVLGGLLISDEVIDLMKWVWDHRDQIGGLSFLPSFDAQYSQMPYMEISKEEYTRLSSEFPEIDFSKVWRYEEHDLTTAAQELACLSGVCEIEIVPHG